MLFSSYPQVAVSDLREEYDYIIVGGGTAGCVIANRLTQDQHISVLVAERGSVSNGLISRIPLLSSHFASDGSRSRVWRSVPQEHVDGRIIDLVGGNSVGGSSKINAMLYTRGLPGDYNSWGRDGWRYDDMQPYFIKSERFLDCKDDTVDYHGTSGEWPNRSHKQSHWKHTDEIISATTELGVPYVDDLNLPLNPSHGCTKMHYTIDSSGRRSSTLTAFLPAELMKARKQHLHLCTGAIVQQVEITNKTGGASAEGIWLQSEKSLSSRFVRARREVILTAGPISSPQILMLSGVGPEGHLRDHGISVMKDLPGVGSNLQDHLAVPLQFRIPLNDSLAKLELRPWIIIKLMFLYLFFGTGLLLAPVLELSIFLQSRLLHSGSRAVVTRSKADVDAALPGNLPDIEIMPISWADVKKHRQGGLSFFSVTLRPSSKGTVRLNSSDPRASPLIDPNYFSSSRDWAVMRQSIRFSLSIKDQLLLQKYPIFDVHVPSSESDEDIDAFIRKECQSTNHYTSTCRMMPEEEEGVVDDRLRVHGVKGLRVGDSSIFPHILSAHLAAGTVAIAEKCADMIKEDRSA
ncbi:alcohol oxidase [Leucogyrophana mollusca]|uniref:Alcohol oxidase n=1 Tax=Leucogyrophana mollusca TaxID=85980 RepID=A0ACB8AV93_9AGAM|nr:alcohol oxidase [Leucogyrophana mollusca]